MKKKDDIQEMIDRVTRVDEMSAATVARAWNDPLGSVKAGASRVKSAAKAGIKKMVNPLKRAAAKYGSGGVGAAFQKKKSELYDQARKITLSFSRSWADEAKNATTVAGLYHFFTEGPGKSSGIDVSDVDRFVANGKSFAELKSDPKAFLDLRLTHGAVMKNVFKALEAKHLPKEEDLGVGTEHSSNHDAPEEEEYLNLTKLARSDRVDESFKRAIEKHRRKLA